MYCVRDVNIIGYMKCRCPICKKVIDRAIQQESREGNFYPFCSQRCKLVDLGQWLDGGYKIVTKLKTEEEEGENSGQSKGNGR
jgi:endogenous inhibitor of DNA gyrase (YacG/DUF329 family)